MLIFDAASRKRGKNTKLEGQYKTVQCVASGQPPQRCGSVRVSATFY